MKYSEIMSDMVRVKKSNPCYLYLVMDADWNMLTKSEQALLMWCGIDFELCGELGQDEPDLHSTTIYRKI